MKFSISKRLLDDYPDMEEHIVIATGVNNEIAGKWILDKMKTAKEELLTKGKEVLKEPKYAKWVEVYQEIADKAGITGREFLPSHVALATRVVEGKDVPNINPIVNLYNYYSIKYGVPIGGENLAELYGDMELDYLDGTEQFVLLGGSEVEVLNKNEVAWKDDHSVTCRMWAWRQCERTKLDKSAKDMYFIFDTFSGLQGIDIEPMIQEFGKDLEEKFGAKVQIGVLRVNQPSVAFDYETKGIEEINVDEDIKKYLKSESKKTGKKSLMKRKQTSLGLVDPKHLVERVTSLVDETLKDELGEKISSDIANSQSESYGDLSSAVAIRNSGNTSLSPQELAKKYVPIIKGDVRITEIVDDISIADNGFINFKLSDQFLLGELRDALEMSESFGSSLVGKGRNILVESPSINPNAAAHVGHLLNLFIGRSLMRLFEKVGFKASADNVVHDHNQKICMAIWAIEHLAKGKTPESEGMKSDHFVGRYYAQGKKRYNSDPNVKKIIDEMLRKLEGEDNDTVKKWKKVVNWSYKGHQETFDRLNEDQGHVWYESEYYKKGRDIIEDHLGSGIVEKLSDGAVVSRLEEKYGLPDAVLLRSDGTSLYQTQDVYLTLQKIEMFNPWRAIWVVGNEQILHFQQLFALLDAMGILDLDQVYHFAYGIVVDTKGQRIGKGSDSMTGDEVLDQMKEAALGIMKERKIEIDLKDQDRVAEAVGIGALRYAFLSRDPYRNVVYDPHSALSFTGRSGPYVMYAYTRGQSVLRKVFGDANNYAFAGDVSGVEIAGPERKLLIKLLLYPETVLTAANNYAPNVLAEYLYDVAGNFNNFYEKLTISGAKGQQREFRLALTKLTTNVLKDGLAILGIEALDQM